MRLAVLAVFDPVTGLSGFASWFGTSRKVVVTGMPYLRCNAFIEVPDDAVHEVPDGVNAADLARQLGGLVITTWPRGV
jgi:hypothetical protein